MLSQRAWGRTMRPINNLPSRLAQQLQQNSTSRGGVEASLLVLLGGVVATTAVRADAAWRRTSDIRSEQAGPTEAEASTSQPQRTSDNVHDIYEIMEVLGHGHFAVVSRGVHKVTGETVAIKAIEKARTDVNAVRQEIAILQKVGSHPNIVALRDVFETEVRVSAGAAVSSSSAGSPALASALATVSVGAPEVGFPQGGDGALDRPRPRSATPIPSSLPRPPRPPCLTRAHPEERSIQPARAAGQVVPGHGAGDWWRAL